MISISKLKLSKVKGALSRKGKYSYQRTQGTGQSSCRAKNTPFPEFASLLTGKRIGQLDFKRRVITHQGVGRDKDDQRAF
jgi:hypothetical protein